MKKIVLFFFEFSKFLLHIFIRSKRLFYPLEQFSNIPDSDSGRVLVTVADGILLPQTHLVLNTSPSLASLSIIT